LETTRIVIVVAVSSTGDISLPCLSNFWAAKRYYIFSHSRDFAHTLLGSFNKKKGLFWNSPIGDEQAIYLPRWVMLSTVARNLRNLADFWQIFKVLSW
jgi:hypothetical protein